MRKFFLWFLEPAARLLERWMACAGLILHFGGGGSSPPPDPAIGEAAKTNAALGRESLDFAKQQYEDGKPANDAMNAMIEKVVEQQLRIGDKQEAQSDDYISYMKSTFRPIEESLAGEAMSFDTEGKRAELAGKAGADVEQAAAMTDASTRRDAARYGINPSDAAFADQMSGSGLNKTIMKVGAMNTTRTQARAEGRALKFDAAAIGRGLPGAGANAAQVAMQSGSNAVGSSVTGAANQRAAAGGVQQGFATAIGGNTAAGNLYGNIFDANMQGYNAKQQARAGTAQGVGAAVGIAAAFI